MDLEQFQRIAKALADPRRFEILEHIAKQHEVGCQRLCGCFPVRQATISHHLKELASAGLVESRRDGQFVYYRLKPAVFEAYMAELRRRMDVNEVTDVKVLKNDVAREPTRQPARRKSEAAKRA